MSRFTAPIRREASLHAVTALPSHSRRICPPSAESSKAGIFEAGGFTALSIGPERSRRRGPFGPCPRTPRGLPFLNARKGSKRSFKGAPAPLKIPRWGALWPCPQTPRPDSLVIVTSLLRAKRCTLYTKQSCALQCFLNYRTTAQQPNPLISGANRPGSSARNLIPFRAN